MLFRYTNIAPEFAEKSPIFRRIVVFLTSLSTRIFPPSRAPTHAHAPAAYWSHISTLTRACAGDACGYFHPRAPALPVALSFLLVIGRALWELRALGGLPQY